MPKGQSSLAQLERLSQGRCPIRVAGICAVMPSMT